MLFLCLFALVRFVWIVCIFRLGMFANVFVRFVSFFLDICECLLSFWLLLLLMIMIVMFFSGLCVFFTICGSVMVKISAVIGSV